MRIPSFRNGWSTGDGNTAECFRQLFSCFAERQNDLQLSRIMHTHIVGICPYSRPISYNPQITDATIIPAIDTAVRASIAGRDTSMSTLSWVGTGTSKWSLYHLARNSINKSRTAGTVAMSVKQSSQSLCRDDLLLCFRYCFPDSGIGNTPYQLKNITL